MLGNASTSLSSSLDRLASCSRMSTTWLEVFWRDRLELRQPAVRVHVGLHADLSRLFVGLGVNRYGVLVRLTGHPRHARDLLGLVACVLDDLRGLIARVGVRRELLADDGT